VRGDVSRCGHHDLRVVAKVPDTHIAQLAEQPAELARHVVVVDVPAFTSAAGLGGLADAALVALAAEKVVPIGLGQPVRP